MGTVERQVGEERPVPRLAQEGDHRLGEGLARVARLDAHRPLLAVFPAAEGRLHRVGHAAGEHRGRALEAQRHRGRRVVPFAADKGAIAGRAKGRRPRRITREFLVDAEQRPRREQHRARGHAGRAVQTALHIGPIECHPTRRQAIEVRRADVRVAERTDRVGLLVVGEDEDDARPLISSEDRSGEEGERRKKAGTNEHGARDGVVSRCASPAATQPRRRGVLLTSDTW